MDADTPRTLPPDPSVPGLWWMRNRSGRWNAWKWMPATAIAPGVWAVGEAAILPDEAHANGWRCIAPAVPPESAAPHHPPGELAALRYKVRLAVAALNQAPDLPDGRVTRALAEAMRLANVLAWTYLTDGQDPPSQRRASEAPAAVNDAP